eukprot:6671669-Prymnesium_polylepis.1
MQRRLRARASVRGSRRWKTTACVLEGHIRSCNMHVHMPHDLYMYLCRACGMWQHSHDMDIDMGMGMGMDMDTWTWTWIWTWT